MVGLFSRRRESGVRFQLWTNRDVEVAATGRVRTGG
jgi:hypothetical protein